MTAFLRHLRTLLRASPRGTFALPRSLMDSAQARAGQNPHHARELRSAALAALRVVR